MVRKTSFLPNQGEKGYILEVFNALGKLIDTVIVPESAVAPLKADEIFTVRSLAQL
ncbi:hypothetical protein PN466_02155 [Roseofilum reptotaenium CS-1145]|uniref:hypothetical protein n=1 Tax=Roseofilum TaxID=1233426 RepID=UPI000AF9B0B0|nr:MULTISPECIES: hypothetical protein [Roseofilum]MBP0030294.1 hypothetical protein [Roseofilum sp. Guam]MDB9515760.1 hypothetical protein [Roseofilum reptotaenium CS-1145]